jgi:hypothetical protein
MTRASHPPLVYRQVWPVLSHVLLCSACAAFAAAYLASPAMLQSLTFLWTLQITKFAVLYSIGSVLSLGR